jgi:hypothetical protein
VALSHTTFTHGGKKLLLCGAASLAAAQARHGLQYGWAWDSFGSLMMWWLAHFIALILLTVAVSVAIHRTRSFFLGAASGAPSDDEVMFHIWMTVLVAAVFAVVLMFWPHPSEEFDQSDIGPL